MVVNTVYKPYSEVMAQPRPPRKQPSKLSLLRELINKYVCILYMEKDNPTEKTLAIRKAVKESNYSLSFPVEIRMHIDPATIYIVGDGVLQLDKEGFRLDGCNGELHYEQPPTDSYSVISGYCWGSGNNSFSIGNRDIAFECGLEDEEAPATLEIAAQELWKKRKVY